MSEPTGPELRIGDSEREAAVAALGDHYAAGRLSKEEYDERAARAWEARTRSALWPLFSDLPRPAAEWSTSEASGSGEPGRHGASYRPQPRWRFAGLLPLLLIFGLIMLFTHFWLLPVVLLVLFAVKMSHYRSYTHGRYHGWR
jgi:Domain of unknown function (DUF1707)